MRLALPHPTAFRHWPVLLETVLWLLLLAQALGLAWRLWRPASMAGAPDLPAIPTRVPALADHDPFFVAQKGAAAAASALDDWNLYGVRPLGGGEGSAILGRPSQPQSVYRRGDALSPGLVLTAVASDHVEINHGLRLPLTGVTPGRPAMTPTTATPAPPAAPATDATPTTPEASQAAALDPARLLEAGLQARIENGRVSGYTLLPRGGSEALLRTVGLQPGDVLLSINGQPLYPEAWSELEQELRTGRQAIVTFRRAGQTRSLTLEKPIP